MCSIEHRLAAHPRCGAFADDIDSEFGAGLAEQRIEVPHCDVGLGEVSIGYSEPTNPRASPSRSDPWRYAPEQSLVATSELLSGLCDMRIPLAMSSAQAIEIVAVIAHAVDEVR